MRVSNTWGAYWNSPNVVLSCIVLYVTPWRVLLISVSRRYPGPVSCNPPEMLKEWLDLFLEVCLQQKTHTQYSNRSCPAVLHFALFTFTLSIGMSSISRANLQSSIDLSAVKHEDVVVEVSQSRLPGDEVYFLGQIFRGSQGQCCWDYSGSTDREQKSVAFFANIWSVTDGILICFSLPC